MIHGIVDAAALEAGPSGAPCGMARRRGVRRPSEGHCGPARLGSTKARIHHADPSRARLGSTTPSCARSAARRRLVATRGRIRRVGSAAAGACGGVRTGGERPWSSPLDGGERGAAFGRRSPPQPMPLCHPTRTAIRAVRQHKGTCFSRLRNARTRTQHTQTHTRGGAKGRGGHGRLELHRYAAQRHLLFEAALAVPGRVQLYLQRVSAQHTLTCSLMHLPHVALPGPCYLAHAIASPASRCAIAERDQLGPAAPSRPGDSALSYPILSTAPVVLHPRPRWPRSAPHLCLTRPLSAGDWHCKFRAAALSRGVLASSLAGPASRLEAGPDPSIPGATDECIRLVYTCSKRLGINPRCCRAFHQAAACRNQTCHPCL